MARVVASYLDRCADCLGAQMKAGKEAKHDDGKLIKVIATRLKNGHISYTGFFTSGKSKVLLQNVKIFRKCYQLKHPVEDRYAYKFGAKDRTFSVYERKCLQVTVDINFH
jgi:hypothetical protein